ncbi:adh short domain containing protein, partial [Asbolus verrucosus]
KKGKLLALKGDIGKEEDVLKAFKWITENLGPVHVLVNSAGVSVSPGIVESAMTSSNNNLRAELKAAFEGRMLKPEDVADGVVYALSTPE